MKKSDTDRLPAAVATILALTVGIILGLGAINRWDLAAIPLGLGAIIVIATIGVAIYKESQQ